MKVLQRVVDGLLRQSMIYVSLGVCYSMSLPRVVSHRLKR